MGDFNVYQRTQDAFFDANALLQQWNKTNKDKKQMSKYLEKDTTSEFMNELATKLSKTQVFDNQVENISLLPDNQRVTLICTIKGKTDKNGKKSQDKVWMHPYLFLDFAMWLNPRFKVEVIQFVYDQLIALRNQIGDSYKDYSTACAKIGCTTPEDYKVMARCLNCAVLGKERQSNQRNELTEKEASEIDRITSIFVNAVENGWIKNIDQAKTYFKKEYNDRFQTGLPFNND